MTRPVNRGDARSGDAIDPHPREYPTLVTLIRRASRGPAAAPELPRCDRVCDRVVDCGVDTCVGYDFTTAGLLREVVVEPGRRSIQTAHSIYALAKDLGISQVYVVGNRIARAQGL